MRAAALWQWVESAGPRARWVGGETWGGGGERAAQSRSRCEKDKVCWLRAPRSDIPSSPSTAI